MPTDKHNLEPRRTPSAQSPAQASVDGTRACLIVAVMLAIGLTGLCQGSFTRLKGGIVRGDKSRKQIALVFTGDSFAEGGNVILDTLKTRGVLGSFFLTGNFLRNAAFEPFIRRLVTEGHYVGPHSDRHLLYLRWEKDELLVGREEFNKDVRDNLFELTRFGVGADVARYWIPPYEHYNETVVGWSRDLGLTLINYSPGTLSHADYTGEKDTNFVSTQRIFDSIVKKEKEDPDGLNGYILLTHVGAGDGRKDKLFLRFDELLDLLTSKNYKPVRIDKLLP